MSPRHVHRLAEDTEAAHDAPSPTISQAGLDARLRLLSLAHLTTKTQPGDAHHAHSRSEPPGAPRTPHRTTQATDYEAAPMT